MSERYTIARLTRDNDRFEILVKPEFAFSYRLGKTTSISKALVADTIFTDANKGIKVSDDKLQKVFKTMNN